MHNFHLKQWITAFFYIFLSRKTSSVNGKEQKKFLAFGNKIRTGNFRVTMYYK